jgi:hypothetical protein
MLLATKVPVKEIPHTPTLHATAVAVITGLLHARIAF